MFYALAPFYALGGKTHGGLCVGALVWNAFWLVLILFLSARLAGVRASWIACIPVALFVIFMRPFLLWAPWNPYISILPFAVSLLAIFAVGVGRSGFLPLAVFAGSFAAQSHVAYVIPLLVAGAATIPSLLIGRTFPGNPSAGPANGRRLLHVGIAVFLGLCLWLLPLVEQMTNDPGNFERLMKFSSERSSDRPLVEAVAAVSERMSIFLFSPFGVGGQHAYRPDLGGWSTAVTAGQLCLLMFAGWWSLRTKNQIVLSWSLVGLSVFLAAVLTVRAVVGPVHPHLILWVAALGLLNGVAGACGVVAWRIQVNGSAGRLGLHAFALLCFIVLIPLSIMGSVRFSRYLSLEEYLNRGWGPVANGEIWPPVESALVELGISKPFIRILNHKTWPIAASVILQLEKAEIPAGVDQKWNFIFGLDRGSDDMNGFIKVANPGRFNEKAARLPKRSRLIRTNKADLLIVAVPQHPTASASTPAPLHE